MGDSRTTVDNSKVGTLIVSTFEGNSKTVDLARSVEQRSVGAIAKRTRRSSTKTSSRCLRRFRQERLPRPWLCFHFRPTPWRRRVERNTGSVKLNGCGDNAGGKVISHGTDQQPRPCPCCSLPGGPDRMGAGSRRTQQFSHRGPLSASA